jgi:hypothetical protein
MAAPDDAARDAAARDDGAPYHAARDQAAPSDNTTLSDVLEGYADAGFGSNFGAQEGGTVRCDSCGAELDPGALAIRSVRRLEGASDPDDMLAVVALECPACGAAGTMVLGYGPASSDIDNDVLRALPEQRDGGELPAHSPPSETPDG